MEVSSTRLAMFTFGFCLAVTPPVLAQTIDTSGSGNSNFLASWGPGWTQTYGQTFVAPGNVVARTLQFQLRQIAPPHSNSTPFLAAIYAWQNGAPTGSVLAQSSVSNVPATTATGFAPVSVSMTGSPLTAGRSYVALFTTLGTNAQGNNRFRYRTIEFGPYSDGQLVFSNDNSNVFGQWTSFVDEDFEMILIFGPAGPDASNTRMALMSNSGAVRSVLSQRAVATTFALDYDCSVFDRLGFCLTVGTRNTQIGSAYAENAETAGLLTAAYRVTPAFRIGGFIDQNLVFHTPAGVKSENTQPMLGAFAVYQQNPSFAGLTIRAALAYQEGDLRITRPELTDTEAGTGRARTGAFAFGGEIAYGFALDGTWIAQPYAGLRRTDTWRQNYTEAASVSVEFPLNYNRFRQAMTSATAGLRLRGAITPRFRVTVGGGMEHDLDSKVDPYAGTSDIAGLETFSINAGQQQNETRAVGSTSIQYMIASNQVVAFDASVRQMPYGNDPAIITTARYTIGF